MTTNTKKGILPKVGIATILVCLLLAGLVIPEAAKFKASAASNTLMLEEESFIDIRSNVIKPVNAPYNLETFVDKTFQETEGNFSHISATAIGNLEDPKRGNVSLKDQAEAIRRNRYMDGRIKGPKVSGYAAMSVLTSGQGGLVSHWSNNSLNNPSGPNWAKSDIDLNYNEAASRVCEDDNCLYCQGNLSEPCKANAVFNFTYKSTSLIEQLRELSGGDVYIAKSNIYNSFANGVIDNDTRDDARRNTFQSDYSNFEVELNNPLVNNPKLLSLYKLEATQTLSLSDIYEKYDPAEMFKDNPYSNFPEITIRDRVDDVNKHNIFIMDFDDTQQYHDYVYNQLAAMLIQVSYDYYQELDMVPKINMVSHSTGGNWNVMFASRHPLNVDQLFTFDAPLRGSKLGVAFREAFPALRQTFLAGPFDSFRPMIIVPSGIDNTDIENTYDAYANPVRICKADRLMDGWNAAVAVNPSMRLNAFSAFMDKDYLINAIADVDISGYFNNINSAEDLANLIAFIYSVGGAVITGVGTGIGFSLGLIIGSFGGPLGAGIGAGLGALFGYLTGKMVAHQLQALVDNAVIALAPVINYVFSALESNGSGGYTLHDSFFIHEASSKADGYSNVILTNPVDSSPYQHVYTGGNSYGARLSVMLPPTSHNLIAQDTNWAIQTVYDNIEMYDSQSIFTYTRNNVTVQITGVQSDYFEGALTVPSKLGIGSYTVTGINALPDGITDITIPASVVSFEPGVFSGCTSLQYIDMAANSHFMSQDGVLYAVNPWPSGTWEFYHVPQALRSSSVTIPSGIVSIPDNAFDNRTEVTSISIPSSVSMIGRYAFSRCSGLTSINIPSGVTEIKEETFSHCSSLTGITIPNGVTSIGDSAFESCTSLLSITIPAFVTSLGKNAFCSCEWLSGVTFAGNLITEIQDSTFMYTDLRNITIPSGVTQIGDSAFECCYYLTSVTIPASVTDIGEKAFFVCVRLMTVNIAPGSQLKTIGDRAFENCCITSITIPAGVTSIGNYAFAMCSYLSTVDVERAYNPSASPAITQLGAYAFSNCGMLTAIYVPDSASVTAYQGVWPYTTGWPNPGPTIMVKPSAALAYILSGGGTYYSVSQGALKPTGTLYIPATYNGLPVKEIADYDGGFQNCTGITDVVFGNGSQLTKIGENAFIGCKNLSSITLPSTVTSIGWYAFAICESLTSITIPSGVTNIDDGVFYDCADLTNVTILGNVTNIGDDAFDSCESLSSITLPNTVTNIGVYAFHNCVSLTSIDIPASVTSIGTYAFGGCANLTEVYVHRYAPSSPYITSLGANVFGNCGSLSAIIVPDGSISAYKAAANWSTYASKITSSLLSVSTDQRFAETPSFKCVGSTPAVTYLKFEAGGTKLVFVCGEDTYANIYDSSNTLIATTNNSSDYYMIFEAASGAYYRAETVYYGQNVSSYASLKAVSWQGEYEGYNYREYGIEYQHNGPGAYGHMYENGVPDVVEFTPEENGTYRIELGPSYQYVPMPEYSFICIVDKSNSGDAYMCPDVMEVWLEAYQTYYFVCYAYNPPPLDPYYSYGLTLRAMPQPQPIEYIWMGHLDPYYEVMCEVTAYGVQRFEITFESWGLKTLYLASWDVVAKIYDSYGNMIGYCEGNGDGYFSFITDSYETYTVDIYGYPCCAPKPVRLVVVSSNTEPDYTYGITHYDYVSSVSHYFNNGGSYMYNIAVIRFTPNVSGTYYLGLNIWYGTRVHIFNRYDSEWAPSSDPDWGDFSVSSSQYADLYSGTEYVIVVYAGVDMNLQLFVEYCY